MAQPQNESNAFTFDEDEDMDFLLEQAANAGSAAVDEQHEGNGFDDDLFKFDGETPAATKPVAAAPARRPEPEPEPAYREESFEEPNFEAPQENFTSSLDDFDLDAEFQDTQPEPKEEAVVSEVQRDLEALRAETAAALEPEPVKPAPIRTPPKADPRVDSIRDLENRRPEEPKPRQRIEVPAERVAPVTPTPSVSNRIVRQTEEEQIAHATAILAAADVYRKLKSQERAVVAQLITQDAEFADDAASIAIRAINTDELTFATIEALKKAKEEEPVDRAFYILALDDEVRVSLGNLCTAFTGNTLSTTDTLAFSRELVREVEKLDAEAIGFVSSTEAVLRAAKQR